MRPALLSRCVAHSFTHGIHIGTMNIPKPPMSPAIVRIRKLGMKMIAKRRNARRVCPSSNNTSRFPRSTTTDAAGLQHSYYVRFAIVARVMSDIVGDAGPDNAAT